MTQKDLAGILEISIDSYSRKERGVSEFRKNEMMKIADLFKSKGISESLQEIFLISNLRKITFYTANKKALSRRPNQQGF
ncbi:helix-turn-helix transcriptional regulator [Streptococcus iniae]